MKLIGLSRSGKLVKVDFYGCPLKCGYCTHRGQRNEDHELMEVLEFVSNPEVEEVYLGGAEPTIHKAAVTEMLERFQRMKKKVTLKTSGNDPDFIQETLGKVNKYVVEVKCPLDDVSCNSRLTGLSEERTVKYLEALKRTLEILRGQNVLIWMRVIPGYLTEENIERVGEQVEGVATEALLYQFMSNPENDAPFEGIEEPSPEESYMVTLARSLLKYVPRVMIQGQGFRNEFGSS
jgi:pyruvate formate lyase activating enzyme